MIMSKLQDDNNNEMKKKIHVHVATETFGYCL